MCPSSTLKQAPRSMPHILEGKKEKEHLGWADVYGFQFLDPLETILKSKIHTVHAVHYTCYPSKVLTSCETRADLMVLSWDPLTMCLPLYCRHTIQPLWPCRMWTNSPVEVCQTYREGRGMNVGQQWDRIWILNSIKCDHWSTIVIPQHKLHSLTTMQLWDKLSIRVRNTSTVG